MRFTLRSDGLVANEIYDPRLGIFACVFEYSAPGCEANQHRIGFPPALQTIMPAKSKRTLSARENGDELDGSLPAKRMRTEESIAVDNQNGVESPAQIEDPPIDEEDVNEEAIEVVPAPVVDDLYLETVDMYVIRRLMEGKPVFARVRFRKSLFSHFDKLERLWMSCLWKILYW
jgi:hypothetical protein